MKKETLKTTIKFFFYIIHIVVFFLKAWVTQLLWNWLMIDLFYMDPITFWQACGIILMSNLLIKSGGISLVDLVNKEAEKTTDDVLKKSSKQ